jgi:hypothetical protein
VLDEERDDELDEHETHDDRDGGAGGPLPAGVTDLEVLVANVGLEGHNGVDEEIRPISLCPPHAESSKSVTMPTAGVSSRSFSMSTQSLCVSLGVVGVSWATFPLFLNSSHTST